jgi:hypothetical protein
VAVVNIIHGLNHLNARGMAVLYPVLREQFAFGYMGIAVLSLVAQLVSGPMQISFGARGRVEDIRVHVRILHPFQEHSAPDPIDPDRASRYSDRHTTEHVL